MAHLVFIADSAGPVADKINKKFSGAGLETRHYLDFADVVEAAQTDRPDLLVMSPEQLNSSKVTRSFFAQVPTIVYARHMDEADQVGLYGLGVKRVLCGFEDVPNLLLSVVKMMFYRRGALKIIRQQSITHGNTQTFSLQEVLRNAMLEKKNLIIKMRHGSWDVKIRTFQGHVVNAFSSHLNNEDAVLKALQLGAGSYMIRGYDKQEEFSPMSTSTVALLAEARFQQAEIRAFLEQHAAGASNPEFQVSNRALPGDLTEEQQELLLVIKRQRAWQDILFHSQAPVLETVRGIKFLCERSIIRPEGQSAVHKIGKLEDLAVVREHLFAEGQKLGHLAILGSPESGRSDLVHTLAGADRSTSAAQQAFDFMRVKLPGDAQLSLVGVPTEQAFLPMLEKIASAMVGCILLVDTSQPETYEFSSYLLKQLTQLYPVPFVIGLTNTGEDSTTALAKFKKSYSFPEELNVMLVDPHSLKDIQELIAGMHTLPVATEEL